MLLPRLVNFVAASLLLSIEVSCQVTLSCLDLRDAVNYLVPGLIDENGQFDPDDPAIGEITTLSVFIVDDPVETLSGLEYFHALETLSVFFEGTNSPLDTLWVPTLPGSLDRFYLNARAGHTAIGQMPDSMSSVLIDTELSMNEQSVYIEQISPGLESLFLRCMGNISWGDTAHVRSVHIADGPCWAVNATVSPTKCEYFGIGGIPYGSVIQFLDISAVNCQRLSFYSISSNGPNSSFIWPEHVPYIHYADVGPSWHLPTWPERVDSINIALDWNSPCIPPFPNSLRYLEIHSTPFSILTSIPNWPDSLISCSINLQQFQESEMTFYSVLNSTCPGAHPGIAGRVFIDLNGNGAFDTGEPGLPQTSVTLQPNGNVVSCTPDGRWEVGVAPGNYTISAASNYPYALSTTPAEHTANVPNMGDSDTDNDFAVTLIPDIQDLRVHVYADPARPGFDNQVYLRCENYGTIPMDAEVTFTFDADQTWLGSSVEPTTTIGNTATWSFPAMPIGAVQQIVVDLNTAAIVPLGTAITHTMIADPTSTDENPQDNVYAFNDSVVGSYDPNDKLLSPAVLTPIDVALGETPIEYTIRFQNTGTYHAERVVILDTLSSELQWESMRFIASSHAHNWYITDGVLHVIHNNIMLPESNANEPASHGFFTFSMLPKTNLGNGAVIENIAHIVFDFNEPIVTEPAVFMVDIGAGIAATTNGNALRVHPNPAQDRIQLTNGMILPYRIMNALGQPMQQGLLAPGAWLDVQALPAGAYIMETTEAGARTSLRFVKQ